MNKYELHVTVDSKYSAKALMDKGWVGSAKILDIKLSSGKHRRQLMLGFEIESESFVDGYEKMRQIVRAIQNDFKISRVKVESHPDNDRNQKNPLLRDLPPIYFEAHWKVRADTPPHEDFLVSFNAQQPEIKYLTLRKTKGTPEEFKALYDWKCGILRQWLVKKPHMELALVDTNIDLDKGWVAV